MKNVGNVSLIRVWIVAVALVCSSCATTPSKSDGAVFPKDEKSVSEYTAEGDKYARDGALDSALVQFILALDAGDESASTYFKIGTIHRIKNDYDLASQAYKQALLIDEQHIPSREGLGMIYLKNENYVLAETVLKGVVTDSPKRTEALNALGILNDLLERYTAAQSYYEQAISVSPKSAKLRNNLGYSYYLEGRNENAAEQFSSALAIDAGFEQAWSNMALVYARLGDQKQARKAFEKVVEEHQALNNLAYLNMMMDKERVAEEQLNESISKSPSFYRKAHENLDALSTANVGELDTRSTDQLTNIKSGLSVVPKKARSEDSITEVSILTGVADNNAIEIETPVSSAVVFKRVESVTENEGSSDLAKKTLTEKSDQTDDSSTASVRYTAEQLESIQSGLGELGYYVGLVDGVYGNATRKAIRLYQVDNAMEPTGDVTKELLNTFL